MKTTRIILCVVLITVLAACSKKLPTPTVLPTAGIPTLPAIDPRFLTPTPGLPGQPGSDEPAPGSAPEAEAAYPLPSSAPALLPEGALMRLGMGTLEEVQVSPDGASVAVRGSIGIYVYDAATLTQRAYCMTPGWPSEMAWSPDSARIALGTRNGLIGLCDPARDSTMDYLDFLPGAISMVAWSPDSARFVVMDDAGAAQSWDATTLKKHEMLTADYERGAIESPSGALSPDGRLFAGVYNFLDDEAEIDNAVVLWDAEKGTIIRWINTPLDAVAVAWMPDSQRLIILDSDMVEFRLGTWDALNGTQPAEVYSVNELAMPLDQPLRETGRNLHAGIVVSPDGNTLMVQRYPDPNDSADWLPSVVVQVKGDGSNGYTDIARDTVDPFNPAPILQWSADGSKAALIEGSSLLVYDMAIEEAIITIEDIRRMGTFSPDWSTFYGLVTDNTLAAWQTASRESTPFAVASPATSSISWSPDGTRLAAGLDAPFSNYADVLLWDVTKSAPVRILNFDLGQFGGSATHVAWSPDGAYIAAGQNSVVVIDTTGVVRLEPAECGASVLMWSHATHDLACSAGGGGVLIIPARGGEMIYHWPWRGTYRVITASVWVVDGLSMITGIDEGTIIQSDPATDTILYTWDDRTEDGVSVTGLALSPDGARLAASFAPQNTAEVVVWDLNSHDALFEINTVYGDPTDIAWSPDGEVIAVSFASGVLGLYDAQSGREVGVLRGHTAAITDIEFAADGRLASASDDGTILVWQLDD